MNGELDPEERGLIEPGPDRNPPSWSGQQAEALDDDGEIVEAAEWIEAAEDAGPAQPPIPTNVVASREAAVPEPPANPLHDDVAQETEAVGAISTSPLVSARTWRRRRVVLAVLFGAIASSTLAGIAGWALGSASPSRLEIGSTVADGATADGSESVTTGDGLAAESSATNSSGDGATTSSTTTEAAESSIVEGANDSVPFVVPDTPDNPSGAAQYAVMADGKAFMRGWYPTEEQARTAVSDAAQIMGGMENVVDETQVDPRAEIRPDSFAVYLQDFVLFAFDSAEITPEFYEFLGFPLFFMQNSPSATVTVVARTDARGTESYNLELSTLRAEAVRDYWLANGGNADQIILDPRGEEEADQDADDEQASLDRRVELRVSGFLAS